MYEQLNRLHSSAEQKEHLKRLHASMKGRLKPEGSGTPSIHIEVFDTLTNETTVYPSISEVARAIEMYQQSISSAFKRKGESTV